MDIVERTVAVLRDDHAFAFEFVIGALDRDDAYLKIDGELADGWDALTFRIRRPSLSLTRQTQERAPVRGARFRIAKTR